MFSNYTGFDGTTYFVLIVLALFIVIGIVYAVSKWKQNNNSPIVQVKATFKEVSLHFSGRSVSVSFVFEKEDGELLKFPMRKKKAIPYKQKEGHKGILKYQGTRFLSFN